MIRNDCTWFRVIVASNNNNNNNSTNFVSANFVVPILSVVSVVPVVSFAYSISRYFVSSISRYFVKNPGVRPIGVGEVVRRIIAKAVLSIIRPDIQRAAGPLRLCAGQSSGVEAAIHSMRTVFSNVNSEGFLLVDASNAFNSLNRAVALQNIQYICPAFSTILTLIVFQYHYMLMVM